MILWSIRFLTVRPLPSFPRLLCACSEQQTTPAYHHEGRYRQRESHCIFKYTLEGEGAFRDATGEHRLPEGAGFLCEIRDPATAYYYPPDGRQPWVFVYACFADGSVSAHIRDMVKRYGHIFHIPKREAAIQRLVACQSHPSREQPISAGEGARVVMDLLAAMAATRERVSHQDPDHALVANALRVIRGATDRVLNASELADELDCSREHLSRVFKNQIGATPYRYIMGEKVRAALHMLRASKLAIKEISARLGFEHPAHFTRIFRSHTGTCPRAFREANIAGP